MKRNEVVVGVLGLMGVTTAAIGLFPLSCLMVLMYRNGDPSALAPAVLLGVLSAIVLPASFGGIWYALQAKEATPPHRSRSFLLRQSLARR